MRQIERAIFDLRRGLSVLLRARAGDTLVAPLEGLDDIALQRMRDHAGNPPALILTRHRLEGIGLPVDGDAGRLPLKPGDRADSVADWAYARHAIPPVERTPQAIRDNDHAALTLMRRGFLIPAAVVAAVASEQRASVDALVADQALLAVQADDIAAYERSASQFLKRISSARVPLADAEDTRFILFREADGMREHLAIAIGDPARWPAAIPVRLHSACLTGDLFGSLRCDCGEQLRASVARIDERGGGVLLYLAQEGRGIGLANKLRAYSLQDEGLDTLDADHVLGFGDDERQYNVALEMLAQLEIDRIELLTNNPAKIEAMRSGGITVVERSGIYGRLTRQNHGYLKTKATRAGHWLETVLGSATDGAPSPDSKT